MTYRDFLLLAPPMAILTLGVVAFCWIAYFLWKDRR